MRADTIVTKYMKLLIQEQHLLMSVRKNPLHYSDLVECHAHRPYRLEDPVEYEIKAKCMT
jgi:hypothetical protein